MPNLVWSILKSQQLGRYAEYYAKMEFASYGFEVYTSEVDDHGVDFIAKAPQTNVFYEVQVKSVRDYGYTFITESKMPQLSENRLVCYLHFEDNKLPEVFVIPATVWNDPNRLFVCHQYKELEYGINLSKTNYALLTPYAADTVLPKLAGINKQA